MIELDKIHQGHAINVMKTFPEKSINCVITSPPYWRLRDYGIEPLIWDDVPECEHTFDSDNTYHDNLRFRVVHNTTVGNYKNPEIYTIKRTGGPGAKELHSRFESSSQFCSKCNAWRGSLGLEPSMDMYINHLCSIFDEAKRVLRDDGTLWVNLGDTYNSGGNYRVQKDGQKEGTIPHDWLKDTGFVKTDPSIQGLSAKSLCMIPFRFAIEMVNRGWILRNDIIWHKPNCMPASAKDRFTVDFEHVFFFTKSKRYYFTQQFEPLAEGTVPRLARGVSANNKWVNGADGQTKQALSQPRENKGKQHGTGYGGDWKCNRGHSGYFRLDGKPLFDIEKGRNMRSVWKISTKGFPEAHFATFPETLVEPMIKAGCPEGGIVYDPFMGAGTVAVVAKRLNRHYVGSELKTEYIDMANKRISKEIPQMEFRFAGG